MPLGVHGVLRCPLTERGARGSGNLGGNARSREPRVNNRTPKEHASDARCSRAHVRRCFACGASSEAGRPAEAHSAQGAKPLDALTIGLRVPETVASSEELPTTMVVENPSDHAITDRACERPSYPTASCRRVSRTPTFGRPCSLIAAVRSLWSPGTRRIRRTDVRRGNSLRRAPRSG
jgi:hypothetical protein